MDRGLWVVNCRSWLVGLGLSVVVCRLRSVGCAECIVISSCGGSVLRTTQADSKAGTEIRTTDKESIAALRRKKVCEGAKVQVREFGTRQQTRRNSIKTRFQSVLR